MRDGDHTPPDHNYATTLKVRIAPLLREALASLLPLLRFLWK